jgi:hypothetical protein
LADEAPFGGGYGHGIRWRFVGKTHEPDRGEIGHDGGENPRAPGHTVQPDDCHGIELPGLGIADHDAQLRAE